MNKIIIAAAVLIGLSGCVNKQFSEAIELLRDEDYTDGCVADEIGAGADLGIYGSGGRMEGRVGKLKCSKTLPKNYCFKYKNPATGFHSQAGEGCKD